LIFINWKKLSSILLLWSISEIIPLKERNSLLMLQTAYFIVSMIAVTVREDSRYRKHFSSENLEKLGDFVWNKVITGGCKIS
jgi:hypothetical protein